METFFKYLFNGIKFWIIQGVVEIFVIIILEYSGVKVLMYFSRNELFIENFQGIASIIIYKTIVLSWIYVLCFLLFSYVSKERIKYAYFNVVLSLIWFGLMATDNLRESISIFLSTFIASIIILIFSSYKSSKRIV